MSPSSKTSAQKFSDLQALALCDPQAAIALMQDDAFFRKQKIVRPTIDSGLVRIARAVGTKNLFVCASKSEETDGQDYAVVKWEFGRSTMDAFELIHSKHPGAEWLFRQHTAEILGRDDRTRTRLRAPLVALIND